MTNDARYASFFCFFFSNRTSRRRNDGIFMMGSHNRDVKVDMVRREQLNPRCVSQANKKQFKLNISSNDCTRLVFFLFASLQDYQVSYCLIVWSLLSAWIISSLLTHSHTHQLTPISIHICHSIRTFDATKWTLSTELKITSRPFANLTGADRYSVFDGQCGTNMCHTLAWNATRQILICILYQSPLPAIYHHSCHSHQLLDSIR